MIKFDELVAAGVAENTDRETCFFRGATYAEDLALQIVRQSGVYHHREQKIDLESGYGYATPYMDARPMGCRKPLRIARQILAHLLTLLIRANGKSGLNRTITTRTGNLLELC